MQHVDDRTHCSHCGKPLPEEKVKKKRKLCGPACIKARRYAFTGSTFTGRG